MIDVNSQTWQTVKEWAENGINAARDRLESGASSKLTGQSSDDAERGRISALRQLLDLAKPKPDIADGIDYHS